MRLPWGYTPKTLFKILLRALVRGGDSIEHMTLQTGGGYQWGSYHLDKAPGDQLTLEHQLNRIAKSNSSQDGAKGGTALPLHLIPTGNPSAAEASYLYRSQAKTGTTRFSLMPRSMFAATNESPWVFMRCPSRNISGNPYLLAIMPSPAGEGQTPLSRPRLYSVPVIRWLQSPQYPLLMPAVIRGKRAGLGNCSA